MSTSDPAAAELAEIRERNERYIKAMALTEWTVSREPPGDVRRLLAAVEAVLKLHTRRDKPVITHHICAAHGHFGDDWGYRESCADCHVTEKHVCTHCRHECPDNDEWPCATVRAITGELTGGGGDNA